MQNILKRFNPTYTGNSIKLKLGYDIDDVIVNSVSECYPELMQQFCQQKGIAYTENTQYFHIKERFGLSYDLAEEFAQKHVEIADFSAKFYKSCVSSILGLKQHAKLDAEIFIITSRSSNYYSNVHPRTEKYLRDAGVPFNQLIVDVKDKGEICRDLEIDFFIDDSITHCQKVIEKSPRTIPFIRSQSYNTHFDHPELIRVNNLTEQSNLILQAVL